MLACEADPARASDQWFELVAARLDHELTAPAQPRLAIEELIVTADLVVGAVLLPGARAPRLVTREMIGTMRKGSVVVDVSVDQGGCIETARPTTHSDPVYEVDGVVHYCVSNMPGAVPVTSTRALTNATLPYVQRLCDAGVRGALQVASETTNTLSGKLSGKKSSGLA